MGRWREWLSTLADLCTVVPMVVLLTASVGYAVGRLSRAQLAVVVVATLVVFAVLGWWRRHEWWEKVKPRYASAVVWLARPVRDELAGMALDDDPAGKAQFEAELRERVRGLSNQALVSLRVLARGYHPVRGGRVGIAPRYDDESGEGLSRDQKLARHALACEELKEKELISEWCFARDDQSVVATLAPCVHPSLVLKLVDWLNEKLEARGVRVGW